MANLSGKAPALHPIGLPAQQAYLVAEACLVLGLVVGYFFSSGPTRSTQPLQISSNLAAPAPGMAGTHPKLTPDQMKQMADLQASTLLEKSKADSNNAVRLVQIAGIYQSTHQFKEAADYFQHALRLIQGTSRQEPS